MKELRRLWLHVLLLVVAAAFAYVKSRPDDGSLAPPKPGEVDLWQGKADDVAKVVFDDDRKTVTIERQKDAAGIWYRGTVKPKEPPAEEEKPDGGKPKRKPKPVKAATFVSVKTAQTMVEKLAPLRAKRAIGQIAEDRAKEFGFDKPHGTLRVTVGGQEHALLIGGSTPGSGNRYARDEKSKIVYVIDGTAAREMKSGAGRLSERSQHEWKNNEVDSATVVGGGTSRTVRRSGPKGRRFWADPAEPDKNVETVGNWLGKVRRLRPIKFLVEKPKAAKKLVRVEYKTTKKASGWLELFRHKVDGKNVYFVITERLRLPATVTPTVAVQVNEDLGSVLPGAEGLDVPKKEEDAKDKDAKDKDAKDKDAKGKDAKGKDAKGKGANPRRPPRPGPHGPRPMGPTPGKGPHGH